MNLEQLLHNSALKTYSRRIDQKRKNSGNGFYDLGIIPNLIKGIEQLNFKNPTPIQEKSIPAGIKGDDIIAIARTGSGKTIAYGIPMMQRLLKTKKNTGLVLVPTRELALQVDESLQAINRLTHIRFAVLIGGASMSLQRNALKKNPRIIIATPGRLMDHIQRKTVSLSNIDVFILDEADRMLDMGFIPDIKKIMKSIPDRYQTMLFSATMPKEIEAIAKKLMGDPTRIEIDRSGVTPNEISHEMFFINNHDKKRLLAVHLEKCCGRVLVFTRTKRMASTLTRKVKNMGFSVAEIHSNRSLAQRRHSLEGFKRGTYKILIATDIAARGIDVSGIELVVNYDMPANSEDYVHRIGRTGRAGKTGHAVSFANTSQKGSIKSIEKFMDTKLTISTLPFLPSEKSLLKKANKFNTTDDISKDNRHPKMKYSKNRSLRRKNTKTNIPKRFSTKRNNSKQADSERNKPDQQNSANENLQLVNDKKVSKKENSFWANFKKHRPVKKKSNGQGSRRKRRAKKM